MEQEALLRLLTPVMKAQVSLDAVSGLRACMESLGGVGYCENNEDGGIMDIARLFRDSVVNTIWEGTTSVMAEDVLRVVKNPKAKGANILDETLGKWMRAVLDAIEKKSLGRFTEELSMVRNRYAVLERTIRISDLNALQRKGRGVLEHIEAIACACLLMFDAVVDKDDVAFEVARRWMRLSALPADLAKAQDKEEERPGNPAKEIERDRRIFLGAAAASGTMRQAKL